MPGTLDWQHVAFALVPHRGGGLVIRFHTAASTAAPPACARPLLWFASPPLPVDASRPNLMMDTRGDWARLNDSFCVSLP